MPNRYRHELALRAIAGSADAAVRKAADPDQIARIRSRANELLTDLEATVIRDGGDDAMIARIERARKQLVGGSKQASRQELARGTGRAAVGRRATKRASSRDSGPTPGARGTRQQPRASSSE